jgi:hypothetical protein
MPWAISGCTGIVEKPKTPKSQTVIGQDASKATLLAAVLKKKKTVINVSDIFSSTTIRQGVGTCMPRRFEPSSTRHSTIGEYTISH